MGWKSDITKELQVFMGDGTTYRPAWLNATIKTSYNVSTFEFPDIDGTLVQRQKRKGKIYDIEFYFQGDDHLEVAESFRISADDPRHWHIRHPFYGDLRVQPISGLTFDNTQYNVSKITGTVQETIIGIFPRSLENPTDEIQAAKIESDFFGAVAYDNGVKEPSPTDIATSQESVTRLNASTTNVITSDTNSADFQNLVRKAQSLINKSASGAFLAMQATQEVATFPAKLESNVTARILLLKEQFERTSQAVRNLDYIIPLSERFFYETFAGTIISTTLLAASLPNEGDYETTKDVDSVIVIIIQMFNDFLLDLDNLQFLEAAIEDSYLPDPDNIAGIEKVLNLTLSNLFDIALDAKKEFSVTLEKDSNAILLTHTYYGLDANDENLDFFLRTNAIGLNEMLRIPKGRVVLYYL